MTQYGTWVSYGGDARIWLAIGLLAVAGGVTLAGIRLPLPVRATRPGPAGRIAMILAWIASIAAFLVCVTIYVRQYIHAYDLSAATTAPKDPIAPITLLAVAVVFVIIISRSSPGFGTRLASGFIGAIAAPMIFELPFDLIVMARTDDPQLTGQPAGCSVPGGVRPRCRLLAGAVCGALVMVPVAAGCSSAGLRARRPTGRVRLRALPGCASPARRLTRAPMASPPRRSRPTAP